MSLSPLYLQLKERILSEIESGRWPPGQRVPSENQLTRDYHVSRMTANRALRELTSEGRLIRLRGSGTYVAEAKPTSDLLEIRNIAEEIGARGHRHAARVYLLQREQLLGAVADRLGLAAGDYAFHSVILHLEDDRPIQLEDRWVNPSAAAGYLSADFRRITPNQYLTEVAPLSRAEHVVEAVEPPAKVRQLLAMGASEPALRLERRTWSGGRVVSHALLWHPGSRFRLGARIGREPESPGSSKP